ncbi:MAG: hypothetical protein ACI8TX_002122 [Hyphomicrobiaceae bacterium]
MTGRKLAMTIASRVRSRIVDMMTDVVTDMVTDAGIPGFGRAAIFLLIGPIFAWILPTTADAEFLRFRPPHPIATFEANGSDELGPQVAFGDKGTCLAVWSSTGGPQDGVGRDSNLFVGRSLDNGATWTSPQPLVSGAKGSRGDDDQAALATDWRGVWAVVWSSTGAHENPQLNDRDIRAVRSTDGGRTWSPATSIKSHHGNGWGRDEHPDLATDGNGNWIVVWQSTDSLGNTIGSDPDILFSVSNDGALTWSSPRPLAADAVIDSHFDSAPRIAVDDDGHWLAVWASAQDILADGDLRAHTMVSRSSDAGKTWSLPAPLAPASQISRPDDGAVVAAGQDGSWLVVWESSDSLGGTVGLDRDLYVVRSTDEGETWSAPAAIALNAATDAGDDAGAAIVHAGGGNWAVAWHSWDGMAYALGADADLLVVTSEDDGKTWMPPLILNSSARSDYGEDTAVSLQSDRQGHWVAAWQTNEPVDGQVRSDHDIYFAVAGPGFPPQ